jgi:hypothetical protein
LTTSGVVRSCESEGGELDVRDHSDRHSAALELAHQLERSREARLRQFENGHWRPESRHVAAWQARRLSHTHQDLLASPRYGPPTTYFMTDLYGEQDFTARDEGVERIYPMLARLLPASALKTIALGVELHALSQDLDLELTDRLYHELDHTGPVTAEGYAAAYRRCDNHADREKQIELVGVVGRSLDSVVFKPGLYRLVQMAGPPARMAGLGELHDFISRGFLAFRHMKGADEFLATIMDRERALMEGLFDGAPPSGWAPPNPVSPPRGTGD